MRLEDLMAQLQGDVYPEPRSEGHDRITREMGAAVAKLLRPGACILDVGCGCGPALEWFTQNGFNPTGISLCDEDIEKCRASGFDVKKWDMHETAFADGFFHCVWARHVLEHSIAPMWALAEWSRVLEPSGILYVEVPAPDTPCHHTHNKNHYSVLGHNAWNSLFMKSGFEILTAQTITLDTPVGMDTYYSYILRKKSRD
jgi:2-polyprenyl-3-methyl-5-hydroxy-6-metoxy-1,4-benzoquinol methylase